MSACADYAAEMWELADLSADPTREEMEGPAQAQPGAVVNPTAPALYFHRGLPSMGSALLAPGLPAPTAARAEDRHSHTEAPAYSSPSSPRRSADFQPLLSQQGADLRAPSRAFCFPVSVPLLVGVHGRRMTLASIQIEVLR